MTRQDCRGQRQDGGVDGAESERACRGNEAVSEAGGDHSPASDFAHKIQKGHGRALVSQRRPTRKGKARDRETVVRSWAQSGNKAGRDMHGLDVARSI